MKKLLIMAAIAGSAAMSSCGEQPKADNPFFVEWNTPFGVPPFEQILTEHYMPAVEQGIKEYQADVAAIVNNTDAPSFDNVILALDQSGRNLTRVMTVFGNLTAADMTPELEALDAQITPMVSKIGSEISLNPELFSKIKAVYDNQASMNLDADQTRLLEKTYKNFAARGANLSDEDKAKLKAIDEKLSVLSMNFSKNLRNDQAAFELVIADSADLAGLPESIITAAAAEAKARGKAGWVFTLDKPSMIPFLQYADNAELREKLYNGYLNRCNNGNENDNKAVIDQITNLRVERANLLGFPSHAAAVLDRQMAKTPAAVSALLSELWTPAIVRSKAELADMVAIKVKEGKGSDFKASDWWYYAEKVRKDKYALDEEMLRPYFSLTGVRDGIFAVSEKLYGLTFKKLDNMPIYHPECEVFEVFDRDGSHLGVLYLDFFPRAGKGVGAWCTGFREQSYKDGVRVAPVVSLVCNFTKPAGDTPALLNLDEVETFFHEFGHGLHALMSNVPYEGIGGVERDFVELPSQIMENWATEPEVLAMYAKHYKTGEPIPAELVEKIQKSALFNQGFMTVEYLGASILDMEYHNQTAVQPIDVTAFETAALGKMGIMEQIAPRYRSTYFQHIFSGGYSSGYYSYIWAEVLDADAFAAFKESGDIFNPTVAAAFRDNILSQGGRKDGMAMYKAFRGQEPSKDPLMKKRGLK